MQLSEVAWPTADASDASLAILPVGSTEQHGPHAPLGTDITTAEAVAQAGAEAYEAGHGEREDEAEKADEVVVAPTIPVGVAAEHRHFAGTLWVSEDTFRAYVRETIESLASHGWDRVVVVNGHGGNVGALREVCGTVTRETDAYAVPFTWFDAVDATDMGHGGPVETSVLLHVARDLVDGERLDEATAGGAESWGNFESGVNLAYDTDEFSENGTVGDPTEASAERGKELLAEAAEKLAALLARVAERER